MPDRARADDSNRRSLALSIETLKYYYYYHRHHDSLLLLLILLLAAAVDARSLRWRTNPFAGATGPTLNPTSMSEK